MENSRRTQISLGTSDHAEAVANATAALQQPFLSDAAPLEAEIAAFLKHKTQQNEYSPASVESKKYALREFASLVNKRAPETISPEDVERFYQSLQQRVSESAAQGCVTTVRSFFNRLVEQKKVRLNPVARLKLARLHQKGRLLFCQPELRDKLIAAAPNDEMKFILYCGFHAGLRKNEIVEARPDWFDLDRGALHIGPSETFQLKDREARFVPLTKEFRSFLQRFGSPSPFMLRPDVAHGKARYRYDFRRPWAEFMKVQKCEWVTPHVMRHTLPPCWLPRV
jgi:integrase